MAALGLAVTAFGAAVAGPFLVFVRRGRASAWLFVLVPSALVSIAVDLAAMVAAKRVPTGCVVVAIILYVAALGIFVGAALASRAHRLSFSFSPDAPERLIQSGPYRFIRHPFYTSYVLSYTAAVLASANPWTFVPLVWMGILYARAGYEEEVKFARSSFAREYLLYRARTGMFFPRVIGTYVRR